jgi:hypothetical protein
MAVIVLNFDKSSENNATNSYKKISFEVTPQRYSLIH